MILLEIKIMNAHYDYEKYSHRKDKLKHAERKAIIDSKQTTELKNIPTIVLGAGITVEIQFPQIDKENLFCCDISKKSCKILEERGFVTYVFDAREKWPFENESFQQIALIDLFEHLGQIEPFLQELKRVSKPNSIILLGVPLLNHWKNRIKLLSGTTIGVQYDEHPRMFFDNDIRTCFSENGFELQKVSYLGLKGYGYYQYKKKNE